MTPPPDTRDLDRARRHERGRAPWVVGVGVSLALHLIALLLYSGINVIPTVTVTPPERSESTLDGIQLIDIAVAAPQDEEDEEQEEAPDEAEPVETEAPLPVASEPSTVGEDEEDEGEEADEGDWVAAADRLRVRDFDPRLHPVNREQQYLGTQEILQLDLDIAVAMLRDSIQTASARAADALDWTWTDSDGKRWGVSPGKVHLGDITLPLPSSFGMGTSPWNREAELERARRDGEIARQAMEGAILETWEERFRAMRERADRIRRERMSQPPDTTRRRE